MSNLNLVSIIIPFYNEEENLKKLTESLIKNTTKLKYKFEFIFVDDGSTDQSLNVIKNLKKNNFKIISLVRNFGQTAAIMAGIDNSDGEIFILIDADGQNDPSDIHKLLSMINNGYDVVSGWRFNRNDGVIRVFFSKVANKFLSFFLNLKLNDYGCTLKAYKRRVIENIKLYGEMHRLIPFYAKLEGAKIAEVKVNHFPRKYGKSKYGMNRIFKVLLDTILLVFFRKFINKPIYFFGGIGILFFLLSCFTFLYSLKLKYLDGISFILTPLPILIIFFFITSIMSIFFGIISEVLSRTYHESQKKKSYTIKFID